MSTQRYSTTYTLEYKFLGDPSWVEVDTFDHGYDARDAYWDHINEFKHAQCRIRETTVVYRTEERVEEQVVAEYSLMDGF
jgi:hypothetical protein